MGDTLTNTQPKDTYKGILKTSDTTELSGTAKYVSDGNGNDSALALSTTNVGIGTSSPSTKLTIDNEANATTRAIDLVGNSSTAKGHLGYFADGVYLTSNYFFQSGQNNDTATLGQASMVVSASATNSSIQFATSAAGSTAPSPRATIDADGLKFGSDSAAANALDDYEEGTWTMGVSFGGGSTGVTYAANSGTYTKVGRQVTVSGLMILTSKGSSTGIATLTGLPFTIANAGGFYSTANLHLENITFANQFQAHGAVNSTTIVLNEITEAGARTNLTDANLANNSEVMVNFTYFV